MHPSSAVAGRAPRSVWLARIRGVALLLSIASLVAACGGGADPATGARESAAGSAREQLQGGTTAGSVTARYVRFEALSEVNGNPWTCVAEFNVLGADGAPMDRTGWTAAADSEELVGENAAAHFAIDGDAYTFWHTQWRDASPQPPHRLTIDMGSSRGVTGFRYLPRQIGVNGRVANWRFLVSDDGANWTLATQGSFGNDADEKTIYLGTVANRPPSLAPVADQTGTVGRSATVGFAGSDPDGDSLTYGANGLPPGLVLDVGSGVVTGAPSTAGDYAVTASVADGHRNTAAQSFRWTIAAAGPVNQPPTIGALPDRSDGVGQAVSLTIPASDPDGDALTFAASGLPAGLALGGSGVVSGTPQSAGTSTVTVQVADGRGGSASRTFAWTITAAVSASPSGAVRYVRFEAVSEVNGNPWTSVAEFNVVDSSGATVSRAGWTVSADSQEVDGEYAPATSAIDGDGYSFWHTQWQGGTPTLPHALTIDLGTAVNVGGFRYLPRQVGVNGRVAGWRFYTSVDGVTWSQVSQGTFANVPDEQAVSIRSTTPTPTPTTPVGSRAARIAAFASGPLIPAAAWRAFESVPADTVRRLASGQHLVYTTAGTTGNAEPGSGSTVIDGRPVVDGTAVAYVNGRVVSTTRPGAPVVVAATSPATAGLVLTRFAAGDFQAPLLTAVQGCRSISTGTSFVGHYCYANGPAAGSGNATSYAAGPYGAGLSNDYVYHSNGWEEEFVVTDRAFGLVFANSSSPIDVEIDGVQVEAGPTISSGSEGWTLSFDYQGVVKRRVVRVVSAVGSIGSTLRGVALTSDGRVEAGTTSNDQVLILGDSINATVTPGSEAGAQIMSYWLERDLGFGGAINMAVGGSGYVSQNANSFNVPNLLANPVNRMLIAGYAPNITHVVVGAGFNDRSRPTATVQAAALATWRAIRAQLPNAKISITDGWSGSSGPDPQALATAAAIAETFAAWGDGNARLIRSVGYVNGTGNAGVPIVDGNASVYTSVDAVHPSPAGARYIARRLADDIAAAWSGGY